MLEFAMKQRRVEKKTCSALWKISQISTSGGYSPFVSRSEIGAHAVRSPPFGVALPTLWRRSLIERGRRGVVRRPIQARLCARLDNGPNAWAIAKDVPRSCVIRNASCSGAAVLRSCVCAYTGCSTTRSRSLNGRSDGTVRTPDKWLARHSNVCVRGRLPEGASVRGRRAPHK